MKLLVLFINCLFCLFVHCQPRYTVVINEIMADPSPSAGLPTHEWIELVNTGQEPVNLRNWRLGDLSSVSGPFPDWMLLPDSFVIISASSGLISLQNFGKTLAVTGFPSLDNETDQLFLQSADGRVMHAVRYFPSWYNNPLKQQGGWALEMIDARNPCSGSSNWGASVQSQGGTPGQPNSIKRINPDSLPPELSRAFAISPASLLIVFREPVDSLNASQPEHYSVDHGQNVIKAVCQAPVFDQVLLEMGHALDSQLVYRISVGMTKDCVQNEMADIMTIKGGLAAAPLAGQCVINEILFDPRPGGYDYVELYNRGPGVLDLSGLYLANRTTNGQINAPVVISHQPYAMFPGDHIVITEDAAALTRNYLVKNPENVFELSLPSLPDDQGTVVLLNAQGEIIDKVSYSDDWHFKLIDNPEGVSLERIDPAGSSLNGSNWHSAASTAGYGTPSYLNSQFRERENILAEFELRPPIFSPDNDGVDDIATIHYKTPEEGFVANVFIFNTAGRQVKSLVRSSLLANKGYWNWDGLDDRGQLLPAGMYIVQTELFNLKGKKRVYRNIVVLARKL